MPGAYANAVRVHSSRYEVTLDFAMVDPDLGEATPVARIDLALGAQEATLEKLRTAHLGWQVAEAMALPDATHRRLADDTWAFAGHRRVRDGARVALLIVPGLLRFDIYGRGDSFSFHVRNLGAEELAAPVRESEPRAAPERLHATPRTEYQLRTRLASGADVRIVAHVSPYTGVLETDHSAVVLVGPR